MPGENENGGGAGQGGGQGGAGQGGAGQGGGGQQQAAFEGPWHANPALKVDDDTRKFLSEKNFPTPEDAYRAGMHASRVALNRGDYLEMPAADKVMEWNGFEKLGLPKEVKDYKIDFAGVKDFNAEEWGPLVQKLTPVLHANKILPGQAKAIFAAYNEHVAGELKALENDAAKSKSDMETALRGEWGKDYDVNSDLSRRALRRLGVSEDQADTLNAIMGDAGMIKLFHQIGSMMTEDQLTQDKGGGASALTAAAEIETLKADKDFRDSLANKRHPHHAANKARWDRLNEQASKRAA